MDGRSSIEQLLDTERKYLETVRYDARTRDDASLCELRIGIYHRLLKPRQIAAFRNDAEIDDLRSDVDSIAHEYAGARRRFDSAIEGLCARRGLIARSGVST